MKLQVRLYFTLMVFAMVGCATPRTKYTDPVLRVMLDPDSIDQANYARLQKALVVSGKYVVVDRNDGYKAMNKEQDRQYKDSENRISDRERYATWGKQFGVGGIVVGKSQCGPSQRFWSAKGDFDCTQTLTIVDAKTGEVIASADSLATDAVYFYGELRTPASWDETVAKLNEAFPTHFEKISKHKNIIEREDEAEQASQNVRDSASVPQGEGR